MKKLILVLLVAWLTGLGRTALAQDNSRLSLKDAVRYAMDHNLSIRNAQINVADADQQIIERRAYGIPQVNAGINLQRYLQVPVQVLPESFVALARDPVTGELPPGFSRKVSFFLKNNFSGNVELSTMVFEGSYFVGLRAARLYRQYAQKQLETQQQSTAQQVMEAYLPPLLLQENLKILDKNIGNLERLLFETRESYKAGFVEQLDVDRLDLSLANLHMERENLIRQYESALNGLKFALGYPVESELVLADSMTTLLRPMEEYLDGNITYENRREFSVANLGVQLSELNVELNRSYYLPSVRAFGSYSVTYLGDDLKNGFWAPTGLAGLSINIPIFDGWDKRSKVERARLGLELDRNRMADLQRAINLDVTNARIQYESARDRIKNQERNLQLAERIYQTARIKYREGVGSSIEITQAEQSLYQTQQLFIQALFDQLTAQIKLEKALGLDTYY